MQNREFLCVNVCELGFVFNVDENCAFSVGCGKFQLAASRDSACNLAVSRIDRSDVATASVHREDAFRRWIVNDSVRICSGRDGTKSLKRLEVEHGDVIGSALPDKSPPAFGGESAPPVPLGIQSVPPRRPPRPAPAYPAGGLV